MTEEGLGLAWPLNPEPNSCRFVLFTQGPGRVASSAVFPPNWASLSFLLKIQRARSAVFLGYVGDLGFLCAYVGTSVISQF